MSYEECPMAKRFKLESDECNESSMGHLVVIDELQDDGSGSESELERGSSDCDTDLSDADIEGMLNECLPDELKETDPQYNELFKTVLEEKGQTYFEVLPEGWLKVIHNSGIPVYLHKQTRVCTVSPPYFIGPSSVRRHQIPISAIPCLGYKKALEKEAHSADIGTNTENVFSGAGSSICGQHVNEPKPNVVIETMEDILKKQSLSPEQITEYCKKLFHFKRIRLLRFRSWRAHRKFAQRKKNIKYIQRPSLLEGTKLISFAINNTEGQNQKLRRDWIMNPNGKSFLCILQEYVQYQFKKTPTYEFKEVENAATPYCATVFINDLKYGIGFATSKKKAKREAARKTLEILIPEIRENFISDNNHKLIKEKLDKNVSAFDEIAIEDPRVTEFCKITTEPLPQSILTTCLQRNLRLGDIKIEYRGTIKRKENELNMTVGTHTVNVVCRNKSEGIHKASQAMLQILHPNIKTWGSLLRLYGNHSAKENKQAEKEITDLQHKKTIKQPNYAVMEKLRSEMLKIKPIHDGNESICTFLPSSIEDFPITSSLHLNSVPL